MERLEVPVEGESQDWFHDMFRETNQVNPDESVNRENLFSFICICPLFGKNSSD